MRDAVAATDLPSVVEGLIFERCRGIHAKP
jgi:hypothetical protein